MYTHTHTHTHTHTGFLGSSAGKEATCNAGDSSSISGLERSPGGRVGYPLQSFWPSMVVQKVENLPAMQETWVQSLGGEDPLVEGMATHSSIESPRTEEPGELQSMGVKRVKHE